MSRNVIGPIAAILLMAGLGLMLLLSRPGAGPVEPSARTQRMAAVAQAGPASAATPRPTIPDTVPSDTPDPLRSPTPTPPFEDIPPISTPRPLAPTPEMNVTTVPELDRFAFAHPRPLEIPGDPNTVGAFAWSPDNRHFLMDLQHLNEEPENGQMPSLFDMYLGDFETGQLALWQENAFFAAWSRDGQSVFYAGRESDSTGFHTHLYRRGLQSSAGELIARDVGVVGVGEPVAVEAVDGRLITLSPDRQPIVIQPGKAEARLPLTTLFGKADLASTEGFFSLAPDGRTLVVAPKKQPFFVGDLVTGAVVAELDEMLDYALNVAWSADGSRLAYGSRNGVFVYDLKTRQGHPLVTRQELGFADNDPWSGFGAPRWSPDGQILLYYVMTRDWPVDVGWYSWLFVATADGKHRKVISPGTEMIDNVAPAGSRAIVSAWDGQTNRNQFSLVDVLWK